MARNPPGRLNPTRCNISGVLKQLRLTFRGEFRGHLTLGFGRDFRVMWTRQRKVAEQISNADNQKSGRAYPKPFQFWRCPLCGRCLIGLIAQEHRQREGLAWLTGQPLGAEITAAVPRPSLHQTRSLADALGIEKPNERVTHPTVSRCCRLVAHRQRTSR